MRKVVARANGASRHLQDQVFRYYSANMNEDAPESYFPELKGDEQREADEWLHEYLRLVLRIHREYLEKHRDYPQEPID